MLIRIIITITITIINVTYMYVIDIILLLRFFVCQDVEDRIAALTGCPPHADEAALVL